MERETVSNGMGASQELSSSPAVPPFHIDHRIKSEAIYLCTPGSKNRDPLGQFLTKYVRTLDETGTLGTIPKWSFVREYVQAWESNQDVHVEKTRQMMITWLGCASLLHGVMFREGFAGFCASRKQMLVDDGGQNSTPYSLLGRMRFIYENLPDDLKEHSPVEFSHLHVRCLSTGSFVVGEGTGPDTGRSGTWSKALMDEAAFFERSESVHMAIRPACPRGLVYQSTPNGKGNAFARIRFKDRGDFRFLRLHWTKHPRRIQGLYQDDHGKPRSVWYDAITKDMPPDRVAREYDISYEHSIAGQVYPEFNEDRHVRLDCVYEPELPLCVGIDFGIGAATAAVFFQCHRDEMWIIGDYEKSNEDVDFHAEALWQKAQALGYQGARGGIRFYGDPAGNAREMTNKSSTVVRAYRSRGFTNFVTPRHAVKDGIGLLKHKFHRNQVYVHPGCKHLLERISDYRYPTDDTGYVIKDEPVHDHASHVMDATRYGATGAFPIHSSSVVGSIRTPAPLATPIPFGREMDRHERRDVFRPIMSGRRDF